MRRFVWGMLVAVAGLSTLGIQEARASFCGAARHCRVEAKPCCQQCCTVMKPCQEVVYDDVEQIAYNVVYKEVEETKMVPCVVYEPGVAYRCVPSTVLQPKPETCPQVKPCAPCEAGRSDLAPVEICRKVPYTTFQPVDTQKPVVTKRIVVEEVPYKVTVCVPRIVTKMVPVQVCCPVPCCQCNDCSK